MKIDKVILSSNSNKDYLDFWPLVSKIWKECIGIDPVLIFNARNKEELEIPISEKYGEVVRVLIPEKIDISVPKLTEFSNPKLLLYSNSRIWYACQQGNETCLIADLDCIPLSKKYFDVDQFPINAFIWLESWKRDVFSPYLCTYCIAKGDTFKEVLGYQGESLTDYIHRLINLYGNIMESNDFLNKGYWNLNEVSLIEATKNYLFKYIHNSIPVEEGLCSIRRDRGLDTHFDLDSLKNGVYLDYHSVRPLNKVENKVNYALNVAFDLRLPTDYEPQDFNYFNLNDYMKVRYKGQFK